MREFLGARRFPATVILLRFLDRHDLAAVAYEITATGAWVDWEELARTAPPAAQVMLAIAAKQAVRERLEPDPSVNQGWWADATARLVDLVAVSDEQP